MRRPFQGVLNVVRFNWPFYLLAAVVIGVLVLVRWNLSGVVATIGDILLLVVVGLTAISLLVTAYVYDLAGFYELRWLTDVPCRDGERVVNINAGFDETSSLLALRFPRAELIACDFYDPAKHTERSIARARRAYPPYRGTQTISTNEVPFADGATDKVFAIMSAHEIRDATERRKFFAELRRILASDGRVIVVEHLRDAANFLAYNIGALHFLPKSAWVAGFGAAGLKIDNEMKITPFLTAFFLKKNGTAS